MIDLPTFQPDQQALDWTEYHRKTAVAIRMMWMAASAQVQRDPDFVVALLQATWLGSHELTESTRLRRNQHWAEWLGVDARLEAELAAALRLRLKGLTASQARQLVQERTGMTFYYRPARPATIAFVHDHRVPVGQALQRIAGREKDVFKKVREVAQRLDRLPQIGTPSGGTMSCYYSLTPLLACLDPQQKFPLINSKTSTLLRMVGRSADAEGAEALVGLIGQLNIHDTYELDVYANVQQRALGAIAGRLRPRPRRAKGPRSGTLRDLNLKDEEEGVMQLAARRVPIRHLHNELTNQFLNIAAWQYPPKDGRFDILLEGLKGGRKLLIEAKTSTDGPGGRAQLRMAIGQLFDYRRTHFSETIDSVDLALLTPERPSTDVLDLLKSLGIEALWFDGNQLRGTIHLI